jgi:hypothetical protein
LLELDVGQLLMTYWKSGYLEISLFEWEKDMSDIPRHTRLVSAQAMPEYVVPKSIDTMILRSPMKQW